MLLFSTDQITSNDSLFTYPNGTSAANYSHAHYNPVYLQDFLANVSKSITIACNNDPTCIFDYHQTGNMTIGLGTLATNTQNSYINMNACKYYHYDHVFFESNLFTYFSFSQFSSKHNWFSSVHHQHQHAI